MHYSTAVAFEGDTAKAFDLAAAALTSLGFRTIARDGSSLEMVGPPMTSNRQSALIGASRISVVHGADELSIEAELGGVQRMSRFVTYFPAGLCLFLCATFYVVFGLVLDHRGWEIPVLAATGGNVMLWLILAPLITRHMRGRTCRGIDALLENMAIAGRYQEPQPDPLT
jgi:hypothetical protein